MRRTKGALTPKERAFIDAYALTQDRKAAARKARVSEWFVWSVLERPEVQRAIAARQRAVMVADLAPLALGVIRDLLTSDKTPAPTRFQAAKYVLDETQRTSGDAGAEKDPSEMTSDELAERIAALERAASDRAQVVKLASEEADKGVFS